MAEVMGYNLVPLPPANTMPFMGGVFGIELIFCFRDEMLGKGQISNM